MSVVVVDEDYPIGVFGRLFIPLYFIVVATHPNSLHSVDKCFDLLQFGCLVVRKLHNSLIGDLALPVEDSSEVSSFV